MFESKIIKKLVGVAVIFLLLLIVASMVLYIKTTDRNNVQKGIDYFNLSIEYNSNLFRKTNSVEQGCLNKVCLSSIKKDIGNPEGSLELSFKSDLTTAEECVGKVIRTADEEGEELDEIILSTKDTDYIIDDSKMNATIRLYADKECYQYDLATSFQSVDNDQAFNQQKLLTTFEQLLDVVSSSKIKGFQNTSLKSELKTLAQEIYELNDIDRGDVGRDEIKEEKKLIKSRSEVVYENDEVSVKFMRIVEDSRCPIDVQCVSAGRVVVEFQLLNKSSKKTELVLMEVAESLEFSGYEITLAQVLPNRSLQSEIEDSEYQVVVSVTKIDSNDDEDDVPVALSCVRAGCSSQLCVEGGDGSDIVTTCEFKEEYACYQSADCEVQANGKCGFTPSNELTSCLESAGQN